MNRNLILTVNHRAKIESEVYVTLIGRDFTLQNLIDLNCPNFIAARRLEKNFTKLGIKTIGQLTELDPYSLFNTRGVGVTQVFVAECLIHRFSPIHVYTWYKKFLNPKKKRNHEVS